MKKPTGTATLVRFAAVGTFFLVSLTPCLASGGIKSAFSEEVIFAGKIFNALVLFGGLFFLLRKPMKAFFANRTAEIRKRLADAEKARADAERKLSEVEKRLETLAQELARIREQAEGEAEAMRVALEGRAEEEMARLKERARLEIESLKKQAIDELRSYAALQTAEGAREILRREVGGPDESALFERFISRMGKDLQ